MTLKLDDLLAAIIAANEAGLTAAAIRSKFVGTSKTMATGREAQPKEKLASFAPRVANLGARQARSVATLFRRWSRSIHRDREQSGEAPCPPVRRQTPVEAGAGEEGNGNESAILRRRDQECGGEPNHHGTRLWIVEILSSSRCGGGALRLRRGFDGLGRLRHFATVFWLIP